MRAGAARPDDYTADAAIDRTRAGSIGLQEAAATLAPKKARRREAARPRPQQSNGDGMEQSARRYERSAPRQRLTTTAAPIAAYAERLLRVAAAFMVQGRGRRDLLARSFVGSPLPPFFHLASLVLLPPPSFSGLRPVSPVDTAKLPRAAILRCPQVLPVNAGLLPVKRAKNT